MSDLEVLKEIPGYKAILKSVLKSQIQLLMEQLSEHAGEESIVLTASINDGSLSHLGSSTGKGFFEGRDEIKSQFLGYCLKTYHKQKTREPPKPYQRKQPSPRLSPTTQPAKRPRIYPVSLSTSSSSETFPSSSVETNQLPEGSMSVDSADSNLDISVGPSGDSSNVKTEFDQIACSSNNGSTAGTPASENLPSSIHLVHTQVTSGTNEAVDNDNSKVGNSDETQVKIEQVEDELEITGVEMAGNIDTWNQSHPGYNDDNGSYNMPSDQPGYSRSQPMSYQDIYINFNQNTKTPQSGHQCSVCQKVFSQKGNLKSHFRIHTGERPHKCEECQMTFRRSDHLLSHMVTRHPKETKSFMQKRKK